MGGADEIAERLDDWFRDAAAYDVALDAILSRAPGDAKESLKARAIWKKFCAIDFTRKTSLSTKLQSIRELEH